MGQQLCMGAVTMIARQKLQSCYHDKGGWIQKKLGWLQMELGRLLGELGGL